MEPKVAPEHHQVQAESPLYSPILNNRSYISLNKRLKKCECITIIFLSSFLNYCTITNTNIILLSKITNIILLICNYIADIILLACEFIGVIIHIGLVQNLVIRNLALISIFFAFIAFKSLASYTFPYVLNLLFSFYIVIFWYVSSELMEQGIKKEVEQNILDSIYASDK